MYDSLDWPKCFEHFVSSYKFVDKEEIYTNGSELIPVFRVIAGWEYYRGKIIDKYEKREDELVSIISQLYRICLEFQSIVPNENLQVETLRKFNDCYQEIVDFGIEENL